MLRKGFQFKPYGLHRVQQLSDENMQRKAFCEDMIERSEFDEIFGDYLVYSNEATFHFSGKVNK